MEHYSINNKFTKLNYFTEGSLINTIEPSKFISIPLNLSFSNNGYEDIINKIIEEEVNLTINSFVDLETFKFNSCKYGTSEPSNPTLNFYFANTANTYDLSFINAGFTNDDITNVKNKLTKSFFRLDFYDGIDEKKNFLFSEFLSVNLNQTPSFTLNRIFWLKNDSNFIKNEYRTMYFDATFFDAKDGTTKRFINKPSAGPITFNEYRNNPEWRFVKIKVLNPYTEVNNVNSNYNRVFYIEPINGNTDTLINFSEIKLI
jgi:hypothetical protein